MLVAGGSDCDSSGTSEFVGGGTGVAWGGAGGIGEVLGAGT